VSDPSADVTSTQSWDIVDDDTPPPAAWPDSRSGGERGPHADPYTAGLAGAGEPAPPSPGRPGPGGPSREDPGASRPGRAAAGLIEADAAMPDRTASDLLGPGAGAPDRADPREAGPGPDTRRGRPPDQEDGPPRTREVRRTPSGPGAGGPAGTGPRPVQEPGRGPGPRGRGTRGRARPRRGRGRVLLICGVVGVVVLAGIAYFLLSAQNPKPAPAASSSHRVRPKASRAAATPSPTPSLGPWGHIVSRATDPTPLSLAELFPAQFTDGAASYTKTVQKAKVHCRQALIGGGLTAAVSRAGCTQSMRASYLSSNMMGTIGVLNLVTAAAAEKAGKAAGPSGIIAQLPGTAGPTKRLTKGTGLEAAEVKGHYLVLVWAEFTNLRPPKSAAERQQLEAFISILIQKTANVSLANRMVTGQPPS